MYFSSDVGKEQTTPQLIIQRAHLYQIHGLKIQRISIPNFCKFLKLAVMKTI